jgi:ribosomal protein S18 acetylase RimI-like enzyme
MPVLTEPAVAIRRATPGDARFIHDLSRAAFGEYDPNAGRTTASMMLEPAAHTLVAERGGKPLGFIILRRDSAECLAVDAIAVTPSERGKRFGQRLMKAAESYAAAHAIKRITLSTAQANVAALDLFLRAGFVIIDRTAVRYWRGQPACRLEKRVT